MSSKKTFNDLLKTSDIPVLVDFYADWCGPCKVLSPIVQEIASSMHGRVKVIKVNVDKNQHAAAHYGIRGVPTLILFRKGQVLWRQSGAMPKKALEDTLNKMLR
ncbi:MAG: thioredoxin [Cyclobacteriaceae bacterium]|nr:thioredoxin [Cyclobacteriaceae bacterium]